MEDTIDSKKNIVLTRNKEFSAEKSIYKHLGESHSYSLLALSMLDIQNVDLSVDVEFPSHENMELASEQIMGILLKCESSKILFKSAKKNDQFMSDYMGVHLEQNDSKPSGPNDYGYTYKIIMTLSITDNSQIYKFYRIGQIAQPRILTLHV